MDLNNKTVLITGAAGFIGSNIAMYIQKMFPQAHIVAFDAFVLGHFKNLRGFKGEMVSGDLGSQEDIQALAKHFRFDYIFHQGAISDTTVTDQKLVVKVNTNSLRYLLDLASSMGTKSFVYASSAGTYGNSPAPNSVGMGEEPENIYGFSKLMMDHLAMRYASSSSMNIVGLRYFNVYGPNELYKGKTASMILQLGLQMLGGKSPKLFKWGEQKRDFVYIDDVIQANIKALSPKKSGVFNVGSGEARQFNEVFGILTKELAIDIKPEYIDNPWEFFQNYTQADIYTTRDILSYDPQFSLEEGIRIYAPEIRRIYETNFLHG